MSKLAAPAEAEVFEQLINSIDDYAIYMLDCAGQVMTWNAGAERNKGYAREEVVGRHFSLFFVSEDVEAGLPTMLLSVAASAGRCAGEGWRVRKDGHRFWASYVLTPVRNACGRLIGFAKVMRDLSERKGQEDALRTLELRVRRERDRLHAAAEASFDALYICEAVRNRSEEIEDFVFVYLNSNAERMFFPFKSARLGERMREVLMVDKREEMFVRCTRVVITGLPFVAEFSTQTSHVLSQLIRVHVVRSEDGVAITAADIIDLGRRM